MASSDLTADNELNNFEGEADSIEADDNLAEENDIEEAEAEPADDADPEPADNVELKTPVEENEANGSSDQHPKEDDKLGPHGIYFDKLVSQGVSKVTSAELEKLVNEGLVAESDLDERALEGLKEFQDEHVKEVLAEFSNSNLSHVSNKSAYLCGVMKTFRQRIKNQQATGQVPRGPDENKLKEILERTNYSMDVTTGQRKFGGPPPNWEGSPPGAGHEVFCGKIPKDVFEDELIPVFEKCGKIWDLRLMMDPLTGFNRGYAFVTFCQKDSASQAVKQIDNYEIKPGKKLKINISVANMRLFVGNIPKSKSKEDIRDEFAKQAEGLIDVIVYTTPDDPNKKNRGFAFLEYESHKAASIAKRKLGSGRVRVWGCDIIVDWADPQDEPDDETMAKVKVLYVRNLTQDVTEEMLKEKFEPYGAVDRVKKVKDYGFIHFADRDHALQAMNDLNGQKLGLATMEISLAKPQTDKQKKQLRQRVDVPPGFPKFEEFWTPPVRGRGGRGRMPPPLRAGFDDIYDVGAGYDYAYDAYGGPSESADYYLGYDDYGFPPLGRSRGRAPPMRGLMRGIPRARGLPLPPPRGSRGPGILRGGRGILAPAPRGMLMPGKRKVDLGLSPQMPKRRNTGQEWGAQPIPQQPLGSGDYSRRGGEQWYQDSYGDGW